MNKRYYSSDSAVGGKADGRNVKARRKPRVIIILEVWLHSSAVVEGVVGFWSRLFGKKASAEHEAEASPATEPAPAAPPEAAYTEPPPGPRPNPMVVRVEPPVDIGEGVTLQATFYDNPRMVEAISEGLAAYGQMELVMAIRLHEDSDVPYLLRELGIFFRTVGRLAKQGMLVSDNGKTEFGPNPPFAENVGGVIYAVEGDRLRGTIVQRTEIVVAKQAGAYRILSRLGAQARHYPYPRAADLRRPSVAQDNEPGMLSQVTTGGGLGISAVLDGSTVRLNATDPELLAAVIGYMDQHGAAAWLTDPDPTASNRFFWFPGQEQPSGISDEHPQNRRVCGWFFLPILRQQANEVRTLEDGFAVLMTDETWAKFRAALQAGEPFVIPPGDSGLSLLLSWGNQPPVAPAARRVRLLSDEVAFQRALSRDALSTYLNQLCEAVESARLLLENPNVSIMLQLELRPDDHPALGIQTIPAQHPPQAFAQAIFAVAAPAVAESVTFQLVLPPPEAVH